MTRYRIWGRHCILLPTLSYAIEEGLRSESQLFDSDSITVNSLLYDLYESHTHHFPYLSVGKGDRKLNPRSHFPNYEHHFLGARRWEEEVEAADCKKTTVAI